MAQSAENARFDRKISHAFTCWRLISETGEFRKISRSLSDGELSDTDIAPCRTGKRRWNAFMTYFLGRQCEIQQVREQTV
jgi:hypothetical protein